MQPPSDFTFRVFLYPQLDVPILVYPFQRGIRSFYLDVVVFDVDRPNWSDGGGARDELTRDG